MIETDQKTCVNDLGLLAVPFYVCECVCVLQCHQMTTLFGLDEPPKALCKLDRCAVMEELKECGNGNHCPGSPPIPSCLPVKFLTSPELNFIS